MPTLQLIRLFFVLCLSVSLSVCSDTNKKDDDKDDTPDDTDKINPSLPNYPDLQCLGTSPYILLSGTQNISQLIENQDACLIYALSPTNRSIYLVNINTDSVIKTITLAHEPTHMAYQPEQEYLFVSSASAKTVYAFDAETGEQVGQVLTSEVPYRIAPTTDFRLFYVEESGYSAIYEANFSTEQSSALTGQIFHEPSIVTSADGSLLYVGESNVAGGELFALDADSDELTQLDTFTFDNGFTPPSPGRFLSLNETQKHLYFAKRIFSTDDLSHIIGWLGADTLHVNAQGSIAASAHAFYDTATFLDFENRTNPEATMAFSKDGYWLYEFDPVGGLLYRQDLATLVGSHALNDLNVSAGELSQHDFIQLLADPNRDIIYALNGTKNQIIFIDATTLLATRAEVIGSQPVHMAIDSSNDLLYVATFGSTEIAVVDLTTQTKAFNGTIQTTSNPYRVAVHDQRLVYAEQDGQNDVHFINLSTGSLSSTLEATLYQPSLTFDASGQYLYAAESASLNAGLKRYDLQNGEFQESATSSANYSYPGRRVVFSDDWVYFAGHRFNATTLEIDSACDFEDEILALSPDEHYALSAKRIFDIEDCSEVGGLPYESGLVVVDRNSEKVFQFDNITGVFEVQALP